MTEPAQRRAVFRLPWEASVFPFLLFVAATPLATWRPWLLWVYLVPVVALAWTLLTRTVVTGREIAAHTLLGTRRIPWDTFDRFEFTASRWAVAVTADGTRTRLPMVRPRDLPRLTEAAGGSLYLLGPSTDPDHVADTDTTDVADTAATDVTDTVDPTAADQAKRQAPVTPSPTTTSTTDVAGERE